VVNQQLTKLGILGSPDPKVTANFDREFNSGTLFENLKNFLSLKIN